MSHDLTALFCRYNNSPMGINTIASLMHKLCERAGIPDRAGHSMRSTSITAMYAMGVPEDLIKRISNHSSLEALRSYRM